MIKTSSFGPVTRYDLTRPVPGLGLYWTTCYAVGGHLIDTGCAHTSRELAVALSGVSLAGILNTHSHEDHIGANGLFQSTRPNLTVQAHPLALPVLADPARCQPLHPYRRLFWGWPEPSQGIRIADGEWIESENFCFQVIYTPGHSIDHVCFYEANQGWLFSGDLYVGGQDRALRGGYDIWQIIASLKKVASLPLAVLFPGSARVRHHPTGTLKTKIDYLESIGEQVFSLHRKGYSDRAITRRLMGSFMFVELVTLGHFSRLRLVRSYLGHNPG